jgi:hypothetical protein
MACSQCNKVKYCSKACQESNWPKHRNNCGKVENGEDDNNNNAEEGEGDKVENGEGDNNNTEKEDEKLVDTVEGEK